MADCKETATYHPGKLLDTMHHEHHWREGNLRPGAVCYACAKPCWTTDCLAGFRCEWCGITVRDYNDVFKNMSILYLLLKFEKSSVQENGSVNLFAYIIVIYMLCMYTFI